MGVRQARDTRGRKSELQEMLVRMGPGSGANLCLRFPCVDTLERSGGQDQQTSPPLGLSKPKASRRNAEFLSHLSSWGIQDPWDPPSFRKSLTDR